jgi:MipA family protein
MLLVATFAASSSCRAGADSVPVQQAPLWEFGLGIGALGFKDYRGSSHDNLYPVPVPYIVYRGRYLRADHDGVRGLFLNKDWIELNLSINATTPVRSTARGPRAGMPSLRSTLEIGPSLDLHVWRSDDRDMKVDVRLPVRTALTVQGSPKDIGWFAAPNLSLDVANVGALQSGWNLGLSAGPLFANHRYHDYFYSVAPQYVTASRSEYRASGGYSGSQFIAAVSKRFPKFWVGSFIRYDALNGAAFADSPLVETKNYWTFGVGIAWIIRQSTQMVDELH